MCCRQGKETRDRVRAMETLGGTGQSGPACQVRESFGFRACLCAGASSQSDPGTQNGCVAFLLEEQKTSVSTRPWHCHWGLWSTLFWCLLRRAPASPAVVPRIQFLHRRWPCAGKAGQGSGHEDSGNDDSTQSLAVIGDTVSPAPLFAS